MTYVECIYENVRLDDIFNGMRGLVEMIDNLSSNMGNVGLLHFP